MSDEKTPHETPGEPPEGSGEHEETKPKRVIGTPQPAESHALLAPGEADREAEKPSGFDERAARKWERVAAACFMLTFFGGIAFILAYTVWPGGVGDVDKAQRSNYALGISLTVALLGLAVGLTIWVRHIIETKEEVHQRGEMSSPEDEKEKLADEIVKGTQESGLTKRPLLRRTLMTATLPLLALPVVLLRDLGPLPGRKLEHTDWKPGKRLVIDGTGRAVRAADFNSEGGMITVIPEGTEKLAHPLDSIAKSAVIILNIPPDKLKLPKGKENWHVNGIVAYSKICTHVGCPAALYEQTTHHILCPCHQSTFDATNGAKVIFGPAARPLPMLPLGVDSEGYLIAKEDFREPVGPSFWERGKSKDA